MLKLTRIPQSFFPALLTSLIVSGCAQPQFEGHPKPQGYLCCNMHADGKWISDMNDTKGSQRTIALGTPAQVTGYGRHRAFVHLPDGDTTIGNDYSRDLDLESFARRYVVATDPKARLATYPAPFRTAIEVGRVRLGMTREQVIMALGYPVSSETPNLEAAVWRYRLSKVQKFRVLWDAAGQLKDVVAESDTRHLVFMDADAAPPDATELAALEKELAHQLDPDRPEHAALLRSALTGSEGRGRSNPIWFLLDTSTGCNMFSQIFKMPGRKLFSINGSRTEPEGSVGVPAGEPVRFMYHEVFSGGYCTLKIETLLEEGKNYTVVGGSGFSAGPIPILTTGRSCSVGIRDDQTGLPVKVTTLAQGTKCAKPDVPAEMRH